MGAALTPAETLAINTLGKVAPKTAAVIGFSGETALFAGPFQITLSTSNYP